MHVAALRPDAQLSSMFDELDYASAVALVFARPTVTYRLRARVREDEAASPADALAEAQLLYELAKRRARQALAEQKQDGGSTLDALLQRCRRSGES